MIVPYLPMNFPWCSPIVPMILPWISHVFSIFSRDFPIFSHGVPLLFPWFCHEFPIVSHDFPTCSNEFPMMFLYCSYTKPSRVRIWIQRYSVVALQRLIFRLAVGFLARKMGITKGEILKSVFFVQHIGIYIYIYKCPDISYRYIVFFRNMMINFRVGFGGYKVVPQWCSPTLAHKLGHHLVMAVWK